MAAPAARTQVVRDTYFGVTVEDPYRWLEDTASDEVGAWLEGQAAHARSVLDGLGPRSALLARVAELRGHGPTRSGFAAAGGAVFHLRQECNDRATFYHSFLLLSCESCETIPPCRLAHSRQ